MRLPKFFPFTTAGPQSTYSVLGECISSWLKLAGFVASQRLLRMGTLVDHKRRHALIGTAALAAAWLSGCSINNLMTSSTTPTPEVTKPVEAKPLEPTQSVKVALLLPLSAAPQTAEFAKALKQAAELAILEFDNPNVALVSKDTKGTPEGARVAVEEAVRDGAEIIVGPLFAKEVLTVAPIAKRSSIPVLSFSTDPSASGNGTYLMSFVVGEDVHRVVSYAYSRGQRTFAALVPDSAFGKVALAAFQESVSRVGGKVAFVNHYPLEINGMRGPVQRTKLAIDAAKVQGAPVDALFIPGDPETLTLLGPVLSHSGIDPASVKIIGTSGWDSQVLGRERALQGAWFPAPDPRAWNEFSQRYAKTYGTPPPRIASLSYDAVSLAIALSNGQRGQRYSQNVLTRSSGFTGIDGLVRFRPSGTSERGLAILEVRPEGPVTIEPAPRTFTDPNVSLSEASRKPAVALPSLNVFSTQ